MMKVLVLNGSPKKVSDTMTMTNAFLKGLTEKGSYEVKTISVIDKNIRFCQGDLSCWFRQDGHCIIQDDMNEILDEMAASDILIWSFPLYYYGMPAVLKTLLERTMPFMKYNMYTSGNIVEHETLVDLKVKKNIILTGCGFPYFEDNYAPLKLHMKNVFGESTMVCVYESSLMNIPAPELAPLREQLLNRFIAAGREYVETGKISDVTRAVLEKPLLPNEVYIDIINHSAD